VGETVHSKTEEGQGHGVGLVLGVAAVVVTALEGRRVREGSSRKGVREWKAQESPRTPKGI
jgi:hypothetical protein